MSGDERIELAPGYDIARVINGCWQLSDGHGSGRVDENAMVDRLCERAVRGLDTFDCADIYEGVEALLGRVRSRLRERAAPEVAARMRVHTKFVPDMAALTDLDRGQVRKIIDRSRERLGVERLDLVQFHWWRYDTPGYVETAGWLAELQAEGRIRHVGLADFDTPRLREILESGVRPATHQVQYSLLDRRPAASMVDCCAEHGIHLLCYGTLAGGFLGDRWLDQPEPPSMANRSLVKYRLIIDEFGGWDRYQDLLRTLATISAKHGVTIADIATRWVLDQRQVAAVIVGVGRSNPTPPHGLDLRLDDEDHEQLDEIIRAAPGPAGPVYDLERQVGGRHAVIMRYGLQDSGDG